MPLPSGSKKNIRNIPLKDPSLEAIALAQHTTKTPKIFRTAAVGTLGPGMQLTLTKVQIEEQRIHVVNPDSAEEAA